LGFFLGGGGWGGPVVASLLCCTKTHTFVFAYPSLGFYKSLFVFFSIFIWPLCLLPVHLRFTTSAWPFGIFKLPPMSWQLHCLSLFDLRLLIARPIGIFKLSTYEFPLQAEFENKKGR
jgi:hypothetical protein